MVDTEKLNILMIMAKTNWNRIIRNNYSLGELEVGERCGVRGPGARGRVTGMGMVGYVS